MDMYIMKMLKKNIRFFGMKLPIKRTSCCIVLMLLFGCFMTACSSSKIESAKIVMEYQVPFAQATSRWTEIVLLEKDEYGRELYRCKSEGSYPNVFSDFMDESFTNAPVLFYLIVQKSDKGFVYCHEALSYIYIPSLEGNNEEVIDRLKETNDWGSPIQDAELMALPIDMKSNGMEDYVLGSVEKSVMDSFEKKIGYEIESYYLDCIFSADAQPIFVLREVKQWASQTTSNEFGKSYVFTVSEDGSDISVQELSNSISFWNEEINGFSKKQN